MLEDNPVKAINHTISSWLWEDSGWRFPLRRLDVGAVCSLMLYSVTRVNIEVESPSFRFRFFIHYFSSNSTL